MRTVAIAALLTGLAFGQIDKTFYLPETANPADMNAMAIIMRTIAGVPNVSVDKKNSALRVRGPAENLAAAEWLFEQLYRPGSASRSGATAKYQKFVEKSAVIAISWMPPDAAEQAITSLTTAIRTVADVQRMFPHLGQKAIAARATSEAIAEADWIVKHLLRYDGHTLIALLALWRFGRRILASGQGSIGHKRSVPRSVKLEGEFSRRRTRRTASLLRTETASPCAVTSRTRTYSDFCLLTPDICLPNPKGL
jgi:hypothetical protein